MTNNNEIVANQNNFFLTAKSNNLLNYQFKFMYCETVM